MNYSIFFLLGSNQGDSARILAIARENIKKQVGEIVAASSLYRSDAWGMEQQPDFLNQVVMISSLHSPEHLLGKILDIEKEMGRIRARKWGPRLIDIDILFFGHETRDSADLNIPHPGIPQRRFTHVPLAEIAAGFIHRRLKKTVAQMLMECTDPLHVERVKD